MRILLADDHKLVRDGLRSLLGSVPGVEVVAEAANGRTAVQLAQSLLPDVVVMDIEMPDLNGIEATRQITANGHGPKVIAVTAAANPQIAARMLDAGATAYVIKTAAFDEFANALNAVRAGKTYLSPVLTDSMNGDSAVKASAFARLSPREREVIQLLAEGKTNKEVAAQLHVSIKTAETHRRNLMEKLEIDSVAELTKYAIREGITSAN